MSDPIIKIENMNKWFGDFQVLKNIDLSVEKNKKIVVCGPSGSGKSTLIRCINRLEIHQQGHISVNGIELSGDLKNLEAIRSDVGTVSYTHLRAHETKAKLVCRLLLEKKLSTDHN